MISSPSLSEPREQRLVAPRVDGAIVSQPDLSRAVELARSNSQRLDAAPIHIGGRPLDEFREWTRTECLRSARDWIQRELGIDPPSTASGGLIFLTGHQPQLNHAGVWMKNVAVARLADASGGISLNLIVDNDLAGPPVVRVPAGTREEPRFEDIPFDITQATCPWEELHLQDRDLFASFSTRIRNAMAEWGIEPALTEFWPRAVELSQRCTSISSLLSQCRIAQEQSWGIRNLELPISQLCRTDPFLTFVAHLALNVRQFYSDYNDAVHEYRKQYRVRNHRHPVPDLGRHDDLYELPFWYWEAGDRDRKGVYARPLSDGVELVAGGQLLARLSSGDDLQSLRDLQNKGRLRPRALTNTLFARICFGDLFIHGIGGARYDEITNRIIETFFGLPVPEFVTLTATLFLPLAPYSVSQEDVSRLKNEIRRLRFSGPDDESAPDALADQIRRSELLTAAARDRAAGYSRRERRDRQGEARRRHRELVRIREHLAQFAAAEIAEKEEQLKIAQQQLRANTVLASREFAACLSPAESLQQLVDSLSRKI